MRLQKENPVLLRSSPHPRRRLHQSTTPFPILCLPPELLIEVLSHLDAKSLLRTAEVCKCLHAHISASMLLQYHVELAYDGMIDGPFGSMSTAERLTRLLERRRAWQTFAPTKRVFIPMQGECHAYELVGGVFGKAMGVDGIASRAMTLAQLPGPGDSGSAILLSRLDIGLNIRDFALDPNQDVMVIVQTEATVSSMAQAFLIHMYIRSMSTNNPHPLAAKGTLSHGFPGPLTGFVIHVAEKVVALFGWVFSNPYLILWNWRSGTLLASFAIDKRVGSFDDFTFLSDDTFMLTRLGQIPALDIYRFCPDSRTSSRPEHVISLHLPQVKNGANYHYISTHTAPFLSSNPAATAFRHPDAHKVGSHKPKPFVASARSRIHVLSINVRYPYVTAEGPSGVSFTVIVHNEALLALANSMARPCMRRNAYLQSALLSDGHSHLHLPTLPDEQASARDCSTPPCYVTDPGWHGTAFGMDINFDPAAAIPWSAWGPSNTRWLQQVHTPQWQRYVHGERFVRTVGDQLLLLDFGLAATREGRRSPFCEQLLAGRTTQNKPETTVCSQCFEPIECQRHEAHVRLVTEPTVVLSEDMFETDITSYLPYREVVASLEQGYSGYMIDDERILGLSTDLHGNLSGIDVVLF